MDREAFISAMRHVAHSVTVVTTDGPAGRHGATVSAFCSVSADPPTALVCLNMASSITDMVLKNARFNINVLPDTASHIANRFAGVHDKEIENRFDGIELSDSEIPAIVGSTVFGCVLEQSVASGSHQVVIGRVVSIEGETKTPLAYLDGKYHHVTSLNDD